MDCQAVELVVEVAADIDAVLLAEPALATRLGYPQDQILLFACTAGIFCC